MSFLLLLYLAEITSGLSGVTGFIGVILSIGFGFGLLITGVEAQRAGRREGDKEKMQALFKKFKNALWIPILLIAISTLTPSKQFMYTVVALKAGTEISQELAQSPRVQKALELFDHYADEVLDRDNR